MTGALWAAPRCDLYALDRYLHRWAGAIHCCQRPRYSSYEARSSRSWLNRAGEDPFKPVSLAPISARFGKGSELRAALASTPFRSHGMDHR
jgi:hypothetical protein